MSDDTSDDAAKERTNEYGDGSDGAATVHRATDDLDELLTVEVVAEVTGARAPLLVLLVRHGLLEAEVGAGGETLLPRRAVVHLRRMQRLRRDLGVNFAGAAVILDLVAQLTELRRSNFVR